MSERTFVRRLARWRADWRVDFREPNSRRSFCRTSRCRERLFCLRAEAVRVLSESRRRVSWFMRVSRWGVVRKGIFREGAGGRTFSKSSSILDSVCFCSSVGEGGMLLICANCE